MKQEEKDKIKENNLRHYAIWEDWDFDKTLRIFCEFLKHRIVDKDNLKLLIDEFNSLPTVVTVNYEWDCPNCKFHNKDTKDRIGECENCKYLFLTL